MFTKTWMSSVAVVAVMLTGCAAPSTEPGKNCWLLAGVEICPPTKIVRIGPRTPPDPSPCGNVFKTAVMPISTSKEDARVHGGNADIKSDDLTEVVVGSRVRIASNKTELILDVGWYVQELNGNGTRGDTMIKSSKSFVIYSVPSQCAGRQIDRFEPSQVAQVRRHHRYSGAVLSEVKFPDANPLHNIRVRFDGPGQDDLPVQSLKAEVNSFDIYLK